MNSWKIYTKKGDKGETSLIGGTRVAKDNLRIEAYGTVDELNAFVGHAFDLVDNQDLKNTLFKIMNDLFVLESQVAHDPGSELKFKLPEIEISDITFLENTIDEWNKKLPELKNFILPAGCPPASALHIARTVCRRSERLCISLNRISPLDENVLIYLNRLSDCLFVAARYAVFLNSGQEVVWNH